LREQRELDLSRHLQFALNAEELGLRAKYRSAQRVTQAQDEDQDAEHFDVRAWYQRLAEIFVDDKQQKNQGTRDHNWIAKRSAHPPSRRGVDDGLRN
jgi:hypothetical protein